MNSEQNLTSVSQKSKHTNPQNSHREVFKDWALTPIYEEYQKVGKNVYKYTDEERYYTEEEVNRVYEFVKNRYNTKEYDKSVVSFYKKSMDTLCYIYEDQLDLNTARKIQTMYSKVDVTNTLKLLLRCKFVYMARRNIIEIFENIKVFKVLKSKAKNLISLHLDFQGDAKQTTMRMSRVCTDIEDCQTLLIKNIVSFLKNHKLFGNKCFYFESKDWLSFSIKEYRKILENALKVRVVMKNISELET